MKSIEKIIAGLDEHRSFTSGDWKEFTKELDAVKMSLPDLKGLKKDQAKRLKVKIDHSAGKLGSLRAAMNSLNHLRDRLDLSPVSHVVDNKEVETRTIGVIKELSNEYQRQALYQSAKRNFKNAYSLMKKAHAIVKGKNNGIRDLSTSIRAHYALAKADYMLRGNNPELRKNLKEAIKIYPNDAGIAYQYAKYEIIAGNYRDAFNSVRFIDREKSTKITSVILAILNPSATKHKHIPYPCNFYTYHYTLLSEERISEVRSLFTGKAVKNTHEGKLGIMMLEAYKAWNNALDHMHRRRFSATMSYLDKARQYIISYLLQRHWTWININKDMPKERDDQRKKLDAIADEMLADSSNALPVLESFKKRVEKITLTSLHDADWKRPAIRFTVDNKRYSIFDEPGETDKHILDLFKAAAGDAKVSEKIDAPLLLLGKVFIPMAFAECYKLTRQYDDAIAVLNAMLNYHSNKHKFLCEFIEVPFLQIMKAQVYLGRADSEYRSGIKVEHPNRHTARYQDLKAGQTYQAAIDCFRLRGRYITRVADQVQQLRDELGWYRGQNRHPFTNFYDPTKNVMGPTDQLHFKTLGKDINIHGITKRNTGRLALTPTKTYPLQRNLDFGSGASSLRESNPLVYAIIMEAKARQLQIENGFNYLGYRDDFVPPWKFSYLVDRARYYVEQTKNLQRDYLNFLSNAEREEFQEMGAGQAVSLERINVNIEEARVDQAQAEVDVAAGSKELADLQATNAQQRKTNYENYDQFADGMDLIGGAGMLMSGSLGIVAGATSGAAVGTLVGAPEAGAVIGGIMGGGQTVTQLSQLAKEGAQRDMEKKNLDLAVAEANQAAVVADKQLDVAERSLEVANLMAQSAAMRLEFANDNYEYLKNRLTNAELWFRLADHIRGIAQTYFRRAIEMSFLAEQVYEFMIDKRINVIRFDYDNDPDGDMLGADYLRADLDYLESHLIFSQREKQQKLKCTISLSRDFPQALEELKQDGSAIIPVTLEYLEQRFPGVYNMKIAAAGLQPFAIMDPTRFNIELTYLGWGNIRSKATPVNVNGQDETLGNDNNNYGVAGQPWLPQPNANLQFPVRTILGPVETHVFTGLTAGESTTFFQSFSTNQKEAFQDCTAASGWRIDLSMSENRIMPGTLADMTIDFYITGYYDAGLKAFVENALNNNERFITNIFSSHRQFADEYFNFQRTGILNFPVKPEMLSLNAQIKELRELSFSFITAPKEFLHSRYQSLYYSEIEINNASAATEAIPIPKFGIYPKNPGTTMDISLTVQGIANRNIEVYVKEDETNRQQKNPAAATENFDITFKTQGKQTIVVRDITAGLLREYLLEIFISDANPLLAPLCIFPKLTAAVNGANTKLTFDHCLLNNAAVETQAGQLNCRLLIFDRSTGELLVQKRNFAQKIEGDILTPGAGSTRKLVAILAYSPQLKVKFRCNQDFTERPYSLTGNYLRTNNVASSRPLNPEPREQFLDDLLGTVALPKPKSPLDRWNIGLSKNDNAFIEVYDCNGKPKTDLSIFSDVMLTMEYTSLRR